METSGYQGSSSDLLALPILSTWATPASSRTLYFPLLPPPGLFQGSLFLKHFLPLHQTQASEFSSPVISSEKPPFSSETDPF